MRIDDADLFESVYSPLGTHALSQKDSTTYRANHDKDPWSDLPDLQTGKQDKGERQALR
jgi:hypothetical protein